MKKQAIFSCLTCTPDGNAGVCTACSLSCHDRHESYSQARSNGRTFLMDEQVASWLRLPACNVLDSRRKILILKSIDKDIIWMDCISFNQIWHM
ncbi:hypothetical protein MKW98_019057 [Papaver atlanticum]|uniref:UBR-type domain-containing protein n=1 Tax=Papaver atlanticum TaxID=357466 RepID=A0AAD4TL10_9MAGN|nr:hypothetical protein MKW98_019057 [Papaver atlanticum]